MKNLMDYFNLMPESIRDRVVIAGGAAVDFERAADVDLWFLLGKNAVLGDLHWSPTWQAHELGHYLSSLGYDWEVEGLGMIDPEPGTIGQFLVHQGQGKDYMSTDGVLKLITVYPKEGKPAQIMLAAFDTFVELLNVFDVSTHMWAVLADGRGPFPAALATEPSEEPIVRDGANVRTPARLEKILARYGHDASEAHVKKLMATAGFTVEKVNGEWRQVSAPGKIEQALKPAPYLVEA